jgi:hypothetical protein
MGVTDMIKWVLILYLFNGGIAPQEITLDIETGRMCEMTCSDMLKEKVWQGKSVVHCTCRRATEFYASLDTTRQQ